MRSLEQIAADMLRTALASAPDEVMFDGVTALEVARVAIKHIMTCPRCGAEAWCDIDCFVCELADRLSKDELPEPEWLQVVFNADH